MVGKSVPLHHCLSSLGKPRDAKRKSSGRIFHPSLTLMRYSYVTHDKTNKMIVYPLLCNLLWVTKDRSAFHGNSNVSDQT